jgi:serine/threonine-protein kinase
VTGELPFQSTALGNLMLKICNGPRPVPSEIAPELPRAFDAWWARASLRDPETRHATADEWLEALERSLDPNAPQPEEQAIAAVEPPKSRQTFEGHAANATQKSSSGWLLLLALIAVGAAAALFWPRDDDPADSPTTPASPQTGMTAIAPPDSEAPVATPGPPPSASATTPPPPSIAPPVPETPPPSEPPPATPPPEQPPAPQPDEP